MNIEILDLVVVNLEGLTDTLKNRSTVNNNNHKAKLTSHNYEDLGGVSKLAHNHEILPQLNLKETQLRYLSSVCFKVGNISRIASVRASMPPLLPVFVLFFLFSHLPVSVWWYLCSSHSKKGGSYDFCQCHWYR